MDTVIEAIGSNVIENETGESENKLGNKRYRKCNVDFEVYKIDNNDENHFYNALNNKLDKYGFILNHASIKGAGDYFVLQNKVSKVKADHHLCEDVKGETFFIVICPSPRDNNKALFINVLPESMVRTLISGSFSNEI